MNLELWIESLELSKNPPVLPGLAGLEAHHFNPSTRKREKQQISVS